MKKLFLTLILAALATVQTNAALFMVELFTTHGPTSGDGTPFSGPAGTYFAPWITALHPFTSAPSHIAAPAGSLGDKSWFPLPAFGARVTGKFLAPAPGFYSFSTWSDDGSSMYIDGVPVVDNDGAHDPLFSGVVSHFLTAGPHEMVMNFYEDFGGASALEGYIDGALTPLPVPEPSTYVAGALLLLPFGISLLRGKRATMTT